MGGYLTDVVAAAANACQRLYRHGGDFAKGAICAFLPLERVAANAGSQPFADDRSGRHRDQEQPKATDATKRAYAHVSPKSMMRR